MKELIVKIIFGTLGAAAVGVAGYATHRVIESKKADKVKECVDALKKQAEVEETIIDDATIAVEMAKRGYTANWKFEGLSVCSYAAFGACVGGVTLVASRFVPYFAYFSNLYTTLELAAITVAGTALCIKAVKLFKSDDIWETARMAGMLLSDGEYSESEVADYIRKVEGRKKYKEVLSNV